MLPVARLRKRIAWAMLTLLPAISASFGEERAAKDLVRAPASLVASPQLKSPVSLAPSWYTDPAALAAPRVQRDRVSLGKNSLAFEPQPGPAAKQVDFSDSFRRRLYWAPSH